jgi:hypothetical protein
MGVKRRESASEGVCVSVIECVLGRERVRE